MLNSTWKYKGGFYFLAFSHSESLCARMLNSIQGLDVLAASSSISRFKFSALHVVVVVVVVVFLPFLRMSNLR